MNSTESIYYVYVYLDPTQPMSMQYGNISLDYVPFYVGKGKHNRCYFHLKDKTDSLKTQTIKRIFDAGHVPIIEKIATNMLSDDAYLLESELIVQIGTQHKILGVPPGPLTNAILSGTGIATHSESTKRLLSEKALQQWSNLELRKWKSRQMSERFKDLSIRLELSDKMKVVCNTDEWLSNKRIAMRQLWASPDYRERQIAAISTACSTDECRQIHSDKQKANWKNDEYRNARTGVTRSEEAKRKMSEAALARNANPQEIERKRISQQERMADPKLRLAISEKLKGRTQSDETKEKKRIAQQKRWDRYRAENLTTSHEHTSP